MRFPCLRILLPALWLLSGCATQYERGGALGGYDDVKLGANIWRVSVQANALTTPERAEQIMLLRGAEIALENGYAKFLVQTTDSRTDQMYAAGRGWAMTASAPRASMVIRLLQANDPLAAGAYDAATIQAELRPRLAAQ